MHSHNHDNKSKNLSVIIILNFLMSICEIVAGIFSFSLALISDGFHNLQDTISVVLSYIAYKISLKGPDENKTYGYKRAEIIAAFVNSIFLIVLSLFLIVEAFKRFYLKQYIDGNLMIIFALLAFLVNMVSAILLHSHSHNNMNFKSAYLHMLGDAMFSIAVVISGFIIKKWGYYWIDPLLSILICFFMAYQSFPILKKSFNILMQSSPELDYSSMKKDIEGVNGVKNIHHVHVWQTNDESIYFEAHIEVDDCLVSKSCDLSDNIKRILKEKYGVYHSTLQFETDKCIKKDMFYK